MLANAVRCALKALCRYMVTKKVVESASETDDETDVAPKPKAEKTVNTVNKKEVIFHPPSIG